MNPHFFTAFFYFRRDDNISMPETHYIDRRANEPAGDLRNIRSYRKEEMR